MVHLVSRKALLWWLCRLVKKFVEQKLKDFFVNVWLHFLSSSEVWGYLEPLTFRRKTKRRTFSRLPMLKLHWLLIRGKRAGCREPKVDVLIKMWPDRCNYKIETKFIPFLTQILGYFKKMFCLILRNFWSLCNDIKEFKKILNAHCDDSFMASVSSGLVTRYEKPTTKIDHACQI